MNRLIIDIETAPLPEKEILEACDPFDPDAVKLGNRKDPDLIFQYKKECEAKYYNDLVEKAALEATTGRILIIGVLRADGPGLIMEGQEPRILEQFWKLLGKEFEVPSVVGFNIRAFDIPFLVRRSWKHGLKPSAHVFDDMEGRYIKHRFIDLMDYWRCGNRSDSISLDRLARFVGLDGKARTGKDFHLLYEKNRQEAIAYVLHDLELTSQIADRLL